MDFHVPNLSVRKLKIQTDSGILFPWRDYGIKYFIKKLCGKNQMYFVKINKF